MERVAQKKHRRHKKMECCKTRLHASCYKEWMGRNIVNPRCPGCNIAMSASDLDAYQESINEFVDGYRFAKTAMNRFANFEMEDRLEEDGLIITIRDQTITLNVRHYHEIVLVLDGDQDIPDINLRDLHEFTGCLGRKRTTIIY